MFIFYIKSSLFHRGKGFNNKYINILNNKYNLKVLFYMNIFFARIRNIPSIFILLNILFGLVRFKIDFFLFS